MAAGVDRAWVGSIDRDDLGGDAAPLTAGRDDADCGAHGDRYRAAGTDTDADGRPSDKDAGADENARIDPSVNRDSHACIFSHPCSDHDAGLGHRLDLDIAGGWHGAGLRAGR